MSASGPLDPLLCFIAGAHGFEESLSKNMGNDTHPRPLGRDVFNFDSLERSLIRSNAEKSSTECEKQQYLQGSLHNYNLTKGKYFIRQYQFTEMII